MRVLRNYPGEIDLVTCATAQHREMLDEVLDLLRIVPDIDLDLMQPGQTPYQVMRRLLAGIEPVLRERIDQTKVSDFPRRLYR